MRHRITVLGPVDLAGAAMLAAALRHVTAPGGQVQVDLSDVTFLADAGLSALLDAHRRMTALDGELILTGADRRIRRLLQITGYDRLLHLEPVDVGRGGASTLVPLGRARPSERFPQAGTRFPRSDDSSDGQ